MFNFFNKRKLIKEEARKIAEDKSKETIELWLNHNLSEEKIFDLITRVLSKSIEQNNHFVSEYVYENTENYTRIHENRKIIFTIGSLINNKVINVLYKLFDTDNQDIIVDDKEKIMKEGFKYIMNQDQMIKDIIKRINEYQLNSGNKISDNKLE